MSVRENISARAVRLLKLVTYWKKNEKPVGLIDLFSARAFVLLVQFLSKNQRMKGVNRAQPTRDTTTET